MRIYLLSLKLNRRRDKFFNRLFNIFNLEHLWIILPFSV